MPPIEMMASPVDDKISMTSSLKENPGYRRIRLAVAAIERGAKLMGIDGRQMHDRLKAHDLIRNYLLDGYEPLHSQSFGYVAESTVETLCNWELGQ